MRAKTLWGRVAPVLIAAACALFAAPSTVQAVPITVDFQDGGCGENAAGGGFTFTNWGTVCDSDYQSFGNTSTAPSADRAAGNADWTLAAEISRGGAVFNFLGGWASPFLYFDNFYFGDESNPSSMWLHIEGFLGDAFVNAINVLFDFEQPGYVQFAASMIGIDSLRFYSSGLLNEDFNVYPAYWLADDLQFELPDTAVPEPSEMVLLGTGLMLLAYVLNRRRAQGATRG